MQLMICWYFMCIVFTAYSLRMVRPTPVIRRQADPVIVQKLWTSINFVRAGKQVANLDRVSRHAQREFQLEADVIERQMNFAVADQLISLYRAVALKGTNPGTEQDGYRVQPAEENEVILRIMNSSKAFYVFIILLFK